MHYQLASNLQVSEAKRKESENSEEEVKQAKGSRNTINY
jgi:bacterioferritin (cytochrome b1)